MTSSTSSKTVGVLTDTGERKSIPGREPSLRLSITIRTPAPVLRSYDKMIESRFSPAAVWVLWVLATGCNRNVPIRGIDPALASFIPPGTMVLAGVDLKQLRTSQLYRKLAPSTVALTETLRDASFVALIWSGTDLAMIARGDFREPPPGWESIDPRLAAWGPPNAIAAARAQHRKGITGAPDLLLYAEPIAARNPIWAVTRGAATVPLTGNLANLNRFLHSTEYTTAAARIAGTLSLNIAGTCRTAGAAQHLERTLRAFLSLATLRSPGPLGQATVATDDRTVRLTLTMDAADIEKLIH